MVPPQGFRHAVALLLASGVRRIPPDATPAQISAAALRLASEVVALARDMNAPGDYSDWTTAEYERVLGPRLPPAVAAATTLRAHELLQALSIDENGIDARDLFILYVPEDRLPIAAPLAIELSKRGLTVAFSQYEVDTAAELATAIARGLQDHEAGVELLTPNFTRRLDGARAPSMARLLSLKGAHLAAPTTLAEEVVRWLAEHRRRLDV